MKFDRLLTLAFTNYLTNIRRDLRAEANRASLAHKNRVRLLDVAPLD